MHSFRQDQLTSARDTQGVDLIVQNDMSLASVLCQVLCVVGRQLLRRCGKRSGQIVHIHEPLLRGSRGLAAIGINVRCRGSSGFLDQFKVAGRVTAILSEIIGNVNRIDDRAAEPTRALAKFGVKAPAGNPSNRFL